jgi:predicted Mrr-cat superfamily restriction endonuclease
MKNWKFSPGRNGRYWEYCRGKGVAAIGWSSFGDLSNYNSLNQLSAAFFLDGTGSGRWNTGDTQLWNFSKKCSIGDVLVAYGNGHILGKGEIDGLYFFAKEPIDPINDR